MSSPHQEPVRRYSYADLLKWREDERWELFDGVPHSMTPAPSTKHQQILRELVVEFSNYLRGKTCEVFPAPFDVRLFAEELSDELVYNVVQPDVSVICEPGKIDDKGCKGSPDLVIEILSPSTGKLDRWLKYKLYEKARVKEYWIVEPANNTVEVFTLNEAGNYELQAVFGKEDHVKVGIFEDLVIDLQVVFRD